MIRAFSKKAFELKNRETGEKITTPVMDFCSLPDWVTHDPMYQWAIRDGDLQIISQEPKVSIPKKPVKKSPAEAPKDDDKRNLEAGDGDAAQ